MKKRIDPKLPIPVLGDGSTPDPAVKPDGYQDRLNRRLNELFKEFDDGTVAVYDEGTYLGQADGLNFIGDAITATASSTLPTGIFDITVTAGAGTGTTLDTLSVTASEDVSAGALINIWSSSGTFKGRNADASKGSGYEAHGWTDSAVLSGSTITVRFLGKNTHSTGLTPGPVFLGNTGLATSTSPSTAGYLSQEVGAAESSSSFAFEWHHDILIATPSTPTYTGTLQAQLFTSSGTFTVPAGVTGVWITAVGGGGGGAGSSSGVANGAGGGGAGELCENVLVPVTSGAAYTVTVGAAGTAGSSSAGGTGGNTSFGSLVAVLGGLGGGVSSAGNGGGGGGIGGAAAGTSSSAKGALGQAEAPTFFGGSGGGVGGGTGQGGGNGGGSGGLLNGGTGGANNTKPGGGGGAATRFGAGGNGGDGEAAGGNASATSYGAGGGGGGGNASTARGGGTGCAGCLIVGWVA